MSGYGKPYTHEEIPANAKKYLHICPVEGCGHEVILSLGTDGKRDGGATKWRQSLSHEGEAVREVIGVREPNSCWCGAPLPGASKITFDLAEFEVLSPCESESKVTKLMEAMA